MIKSLLKGRGKTVKKIREYIRNKGQICTLMELAEYTGVTFQRIEQLKKKYDLSEVIRYKKIVQCSKCGKELRKGFEKAEEEMCSDCRLKRKLMEVVCEQCSKSFMITKKAFLSRVNRKQNKNSLFCSKQCWGVYAGKHYGWGNPLHPHNIKKLKGGNDDRRNIQTLLQKRRRTKSIQ
jgi:hypothetical protein